MAESTEVQWDTEPDPFRAKYGQLYDICENGQECTKARSDAVFTVCREKARRGKGVHTVIVRIMAVGEIDEWDGVGFFGTDTEHNNTRSNVLLRTDGSISVQAAKVGSLRRGLKEGDVVEATLDIEQRTVHFQVNCEEDMQFSAVSEPSNAWSLPYSFGVGFRHLGWKVQFANTTVLILLGLAPQPDEVVLVTCTKLSGDTVCTLAMKPGDAFREVRSRVAEILEVQALNVTLMLEGESDAQAELDATLCPAVSQNILGIGSTTEVADCSEAAAEGV